MEPCGSRYQKRGFVFGYISHYEGMETGDIVARVVEGRVNKVNVVHVDDEGNLRKAKGEVSPDIILRELPFKVFITSPRLMCLTCGACLFSIVLLSGKSGRALTGFAKLSSTCAARNCCNT